MDSSAATDFYTLEQVLDALGRAVDRALPPRLWVIAEIAQINAVKGHVYLDLVQKDRNALLAKTRAMIWQTQARPILQAFQATTGQPLSVGMSALMCVTANLHPVFGLGLEIHGIDGDYTVGEMARQKREVIERLDREGLLALNKALTYPLVPLCIGIISSASAAGYEDFVHQLQNNSHGYRFKLILFEASMQGETAEQSLKSAISQAARNIESIDILVVIRGGGSRTDLHCFDTYGVAKELARFPIPVLTGIGHERDESVADLVAYQSCKTPTALAELIICQIVEFEDRLLEYQTRIIRTATTRLTICRDEIADALRRLQTGVLQMTGRHAYELATLTQQVGSIATLRLERERTSLDRLADKVKLLDPANILRRGYGLIYSGEKLVRGVRDVEVGRQLRVQLMNGQLGAVVTDMQNEEAERDAV